MYPLSVDNHMRLHQNKILITGGSAGIGLAMAKKFLSLQNQVLIIGRDEQKLQQAQAAFPQLIPYVCDVSDENQVESLVKLIQIKHPDLNVLVNNAGIQFRYTFLEDAKALSKVEQEMQINLLAPIRLIVRLLPILVKQPEAAIVNVSSGLALAPKGNAPIYCSSKAGLHSFSKGLRYQLENTPIKVFELLPPMVDTAMTLGRGKKKMSPEQLVEGFIRDFRKDRYETYAGPVKLLRAMLRLAPNFAYNVIKKRN